MKASVRNGEAKLKTGAKRRTPGRRFIHGAAVKANGAARRVLRLRWAREASIAVVATIVVLMVMPTGVLASSNAPAMPTAYPYSYGTPVVPKNVGASGPAGIAVPLSSVGLRVPASSVGVQGKVGPANLANPEILPWTKTASTITVTVYNGTLHPAAATLSVGATVSLENVTYGTSSSDETVAGIATFDLFEGWWVLTITVPTTYVNFTQLVDITTGSAALTRYLPPASNSTVAVGNGDAPAGVIWAQTCGGSGSNCGQYACEVYVCQQVYVTLWNDTHSPADLAASAITGSNGTAEFSHVNTAYTYTLNWTGWDDPLTGETYHLTNVTQTSIVPNANFVAAPDYTRWTGFWSTTGSVSGTSFPAAGTGSTWYVTSSTVVTGGVTYLSGMVATSPGVSLTFSDATVYANDSHSMAYSDTSSIDFHNSTLVSLSNYGTMYSFGTNLVSLDHSTFIGSFNSASSRYWLQTQESPPAFANNSIIENLPGTYTLPTDSSAYINDYIWNVTDPHGYQFLFAPVMTHDTLFNVAKETVYYSGENFSYDRFNDTLLEYCPATCTASYLNLNEDWFGPNITSGHTAVTSDLALGAAEISRGNITHCLFQFTMDYGKTYAQVEGNYAYVQLQSYGNVSYTEFQSDYAVEIETILYTGADSTMYNDLFLGNSDNVTTASAVLNTTAGQNFGWVLSSGTSVMDTTFDGTIGVSTNDFVAVSHCLFDGITFTNTVSAVGLQDVPTLGVVYSNDTWSGEYMNWNFILTKSPGVQGGVTLADDEYQWPTYVTYTRDSFLSRILGGGIGGPAAGILAGVSNVTYCLFANNQSSGPTPYYSSQTGPPADILLAETSAMGAGWVTNVSYNWFLNLNSRTVAIENYNKYGGGSAIVGRLDLWDNRFLYAPSPDQTTVPLGPRSLVTTYAILANENLRILSPNQNQFVWNTSVQNYTPSNTLSAYFYNTTPDVNTSTGTPTVSFLNGWDGGPQPNFYWHGYNYSESVEPTYIAIGVNSTVAPPLTLEFTGLTYDTAYTVYGYDTATGAVTYSQNYIAPPSGIVNQTYNPATMGTDPTFYIVPTPGGSAGGGGGGGGGGTTSNPNGTTTVPPNGGFQWPSLNLPALSLNAQLLVGLLLVALGAAILVIGPGNTKVGGMVVAFFGILVAFV